MKIVYLGNYTAPWCTEVHLARELESLGHDVCRVQEPVGGGDASTLALLECEAEGADLLLWTRTWSLPPHATKLWRRLEANGTTTASYHLDLYRGLSREDRIETDPFWTTQWVATPDGNPGAQEWFEARGINHVYSPPGVVSDECYIGTPRAEFEVPVVFVGSEGYHSEHAMRAALLGWLPATYGSRYRRFGGDVPGGPTRGRALNDLYASCGVVVGDSCFATRDSVYTSDRLFETTGRGGFLLYPRLDYWVEALRDVPSVDWYEPNDLDSLRERIDWWLAAFAEEPSLRPRLVAEGSAWVREHASYRVRLAKFLDTIGVS